jgi:hypothetical protein
LETKILEEKISHLQKDRTEYVWDYPNKVILNKDFCDYPETSVTDNQETI